MKKKKQKRPKTPVFFENFAPPKKENKKNLASKKRYLSSPKETPVNLLISILHAHEKEKKEKNNKKNESKEKTAKKKSSISTSKRGVSLPINL